MFVGADAEALERLAAALEDAAGRLEAAGKLVRSRLHASPWSGRSADRFRSSFDGSGMRSIRAAAAALRQGGSELRRNAREQRSASDGATGSTGGAMRNAAFAAAVPGSAGTPLGGIVALGSAGYWIDQLRTGRSIIDTGKALAAGKYAKAPGALDVVNLGIDGYRFRDAWHAWVADPSRQTFDDVLRKGVDVAWSGAGIAFPEVGLLKSGWDVGYYVGRGATNYMESRTHYQEAFLADTIYKQYGQADVTPAQAAQLSRRYDGVRGFGNFLYDAVH